MALCDSFNCEEIGIVSIIIGLIILCCCCVCCCYFRYCCYNLCLKKKVNKKKVKKCQGKTHNKKKQKKKKTNSVLNENENNHLKDTMNNNHNIGVSISFNGEIVNPECVSIQSESFKSTNIIATVPNINIHNNGNNNIVNQCNGNNINIKKCDQIHRLIGIMIKYEHWNSIDNGEPKWSVISQQFGYYDLTTLIDDYNHYLSNHNDRDSFIYIYDQIFSNIDSVCDKNHSFDEIGNSRMHLMQYVNDNNNGQTSFQLSMLDIFSLEILDKMHTEFFHHHEQEQEQKEPQTNLLVDTPCDDDENENDYNFNNVLTIIDEIENSPSSFYTEQVQQTQYQQEEEEEREEEEGQVPFEVTTKRQPSISPLLAMHAKRSKKYVTSIVDEEIAIEKTETMYSNFSVDEGFTDSDDDDNKDDKDGDTNSTKYNGYYCFGRRWYYWDKHKNDPLYKDIRIIQKYDTFKYELINNNSYQISAIDWKATLEKAKSYILCMRAKSLIADKYMVRNYYDDENIYQNGIEIKHLMAILFYCNFDDLQSRFTESFRLLHSEGTDWTQCKTRNSEFSNWSKILRESVELFGVKMRSYPDIRLYHGINSELLFSSIICKFCAPTSFSSTRGIAESFSKGAGLIIEVKAYDDNVKFYDCSWLSNFPNETEKLLIGGYECVQLNNIVLSRLSHNYSFYVKAIGIIQNMFAGRHNPQKRVNKKTIVAVKKLIKYQQQQQRSIIQGSTMGIPSYIEQLWSNCCKKWQKIEIDIEKFNKKTEYGHFKDLFIDTNDDWVDIEAICLIFCNAKYIVISGLCSLNEISNRLLDILNNEALQNVVQIEFENINNCDDINDLNRNSLKDICWKLEDDTKDENGKLIFLRDSSTKK